MISYWNFNEPVSGFYTDFAGSNNGTGTTTPVAGQVNGAQQFNGTTDKIEVPADPSFDFAATDNFSVEFWYKGVLSPYGAAVSIFISSNVSGGILAL